MRGKNLRRLRAAVQLAVLAGILFAGFEFYRFALHYADPSAPEVPRPASIEGFLPIGGFMATKYFLATGIVDPVHPAGFVIFAAAVLVSIAAKKGFCGWICPVGTVSEYTWKLGEFMLKRSPRLPAWADYSLMSVKYMVMGLFFFVIGIAMNPTLIMLFIISEYYKIVDVRMLLFFTDISVLAASVIGAIIVLSIFFKNFWCRYLCPYGALLGLASYLSPLKIRRDAGKCTSCGNCTSSCPSNIDVMNKASVTSPECMGCLTCISQCPAEGALSVATMRKGIMRAFKPVVFVAALLGVFYGVVALGMATGNWQTKMSYEEYKRLVPTIATPELKKKSQNSSETRPPSSSSPSSPSSPSGQASGPLSGPASDR